MKSFRLIALVLLVLSLALAFASCGGGSNSGGGGTTYYRYENGKTDPNDWIKLDGKNWSADDETSGRYEQKGTSLTFYSTIFGEEEEVWTGTLKDGKLTIDFLGVTADYYAAGKAPTSGGNNSGGNNDTPRVTTAVTCQITYDANGGAFADGKTTLTVTEQENAALTAPDSPVRDNYTFAGWAKQKKGTDLWDFASDKATGNTTLYATWKEKSASILSMDGATIDGNSIFLFVDRNTESVSLSGKVVCSSDSIWKLYYDKLGQVEIPTKIAAGMDGELDDGDNVFYVVVTSNDGTQVNVYDLTVHRSYQVAIRYYNGTDLLKTETAYTGSTYTTGYRPEIMGYTFNRWKTKTGAAAESSFTIWDEQSFYADKTAKTYTVTLDVNGGNPLSQTTKTVTYDAAYSLGRPTRTGYSFAGWTVGGTLVTDASGSGLAEWTYDGNRTLRAAWTANTYQVSLYRSVDEGGSVTGAGSYTYGQTATVSATTNNGYTWLGWYDKNGSRVSENTDYSFTMGLDTTLTAKWTYYTLTTGTNDANAGSYSGYSATKVTAGRSVTISASTRNGYTWLGWYNGDVKLTDELSYTFVMPTENVTYTAKWIACPVTLERNLAAGGSVSGVSGATAAGRNTTITATTNNGYTWLGWFDGETKLTDELSYTFVMPTESVTYTAKWTYYTLSLNQTVGGTITGISTVSFNLNGASGSIPDQTVSLSDSLTYPDVPTRSGYLFTGWYTDQACTELFDFSSDLSGDLTLYAGWYAYSGSVMEINQYGSDNLLATSNAGTSSSSPKYIYFRALTSGTYYFGYKNGSSSTTYSTYLYIYDVTAGKTLMSNTMCYSTSVHAQSLSLVAGHVYYARIYRYSMSYSTTFYTYIQGTKLPTAGGKNSLNNNTTTKINAGRSVTLSASTENGYTWLGWYDGETKLTDKLTYTFVMPVENVTYTAKWIVCPVILARDPVEGGSVSGVSGATVAGKDTTITATTNNGYTWLGWFNGDTKLTENTSYTFTMSTENVTYTAKWTYYTLTTGTNDANAGTYTIKNAQKTTAGQSVTLTASTKTGYTWLGWYDGDTKLTENMSYTFTMPTENVTYTAKWTYYTLTTGTNDANAGTYTSKNAQKTTAGQSVTLTASTNNGYTWLGWYNGETRLTDELTYTFAMPNENIIYEARWIKVSVVSNDTAAGSITSLGGKYKTGDEVTVTASTNSGYTWLGWYDGDTKLTDQRSYTFVMPTESVTYTAKWACYTLTTNTNDANAGTYTTKNAVKTTAGTSISLSASTNSGYTWLGWYDGDTKLTDERSYTFAMPTESVTYTAKWACYTLTTNTNDVHAGTYTSKNAQKTTAGQSVTLTASTKTGYTWLGWFDGETKLTDELSYTFAMAAESVTYTAKWFLAPTVTSSNTSAGSVSGMPSTTTNGQTISVTATDANLGYTFLGWFAGDEKLTGDSTYTFVLTETSPSLIAKYLLRAEMSNFTFTSTLSTCTITGIIDKTVTSLTVPDYVTTINEGAFSGCSSLVSITIPFVGGNRKTASDTYQYPFGYIFGTNSYTGGTSKSQTYYGSSTSSTTSTTYYIPSSLKTVTVTGGKILRGAFYNCSGLTSVTIPDSVTSIGDYAFYNCSGLTSISIPDSVTGIGDHAFYGCSGLPSVTLGSGVTNIGDYAFSGCSGLTSISIPDSVTGIGDYVFYGCLGLTSVTIPDSVTSIGYQSFYGCTGLTSVTLGSGVTNIGNYAFYNCSGLTSVTIPDSVTSIGYQSFYGCTGLTSATIGNGVTRIGQYAFRDCTGLTSVTIPDSVTSIENYAFSGCSGLTSITIPDSVTKINQSAFSGCSGLTEIVIPDNVTSIGDYAFDRCTGLTSVTIPNGVTSIGNYAFSGCSGLTSVTIGDSVTSIGQYAFSGCSGLTSVTIGNGVESIGGSAFRDCTGLTSVTIPDSVTSIGNSAFYNCSSLTSVTIGNGVTSIYNDAFSNSYKLIEVCNLSSLSITARDTNNGSVGYYAKHVYSSGDSYLTTTADGFVFYDDRTNVYLVSYIGDLTELTLPANYNGKNYAIYQYAFVYCTGLTSITIPDSVTNIVEYAFYGCTSLTSVIWNATNCTTAGSYYSPIFYGCTNLTTVTFGDNVKTIPAYAFRDCTGLTSVTIPDSVTSIGDTAFSGCTGLTSVTIPDSVTSIGDAAFYGCTGLTSITIPDSVTSIGYSAFYGCTGLTSITIPDSVTSIGNQAFRECTHLTSVTIGSGVTRIGERAFNGCILLISVTIPASVKSIGEWAFFSDKLIEVCNLSSLSITAGDTNNGSVGYYAKHVYSSGDSYLTTTADGFVFYDDGTNVYLVSYIGDLTELTLPANYNGKNYAIYQYAFAYCTGLTSITIPDSVTSIGQNAFRDCTGLTSVTIPDSVTSIENYAFSGCSGLTSVTIGNGVTSIGEEAFHNCTGLTSVVWNATNCTTAGSSSHPIFSGCTNLATVTFGDNVKTIPVNAFRGCSGLTSVVWNATNCTTEGSSYSSIFSGCSKLTTVTFGDNVKTIPAYAFYDRSGLKSVTIGNGVTSIGYQSFYGCTGLTSITIPNSVTSIGGGAFSGCTGLTSVTIPNSVTSIGGDAFNNCSGLTSVTIGSGVSPIFSGCTKLTTVTFGDNVKTIPANAFKGCTGLTSVTIGNGVTSIGGDAFYNCTALKAVNYTGEVAGWCGIAFGSSSANPLYYAHNLYINGELVTKLVISDGVTSIGDYAFDRCTGLISVTIGDSVTSIGQYAFYGCTGLTSVTIGNGVTDIGAYAFSSCSKLTSVTIPDGVTSIGNYAFSGCSGLTSVTIGNGVTDIGAYAFSSCSKLTSVTIPDGVTSIGRYAFSGCSKLTSVTFPNKNGWYVTQTSGASSGTNMTVNDASANATNLTSKYYNYYWYRK